MDPVVATLIGTVVSSVTGIIVAVIASDARIKKEKEADRMEAALREQRQELKFEQIEKKLDEHNGYAQKFSETHDSIIALSNDIKWIKEAMDGKK